MIREIQSEQKVWQKKNFGDSPSHHPLLGISEEVGELCHAHLKQEQGIRNGEDHNHEIKDALADIFIFCCSYANVRGIDLQDVIEETWAQVKKRDWKKYSANGESR